MTVKVKVRELISVSFFIYLFILAATCGINCRYYVINSCNRVSFDPIHISVAQGQQENKKSDQYPGRRKCSDKTVLMMGGWDGGVICST